MAFEQKTVLIVGQGYVGLPLAMRAAEVGHLVIGFDTNAKRIASLEAGRSYIEDVDDGQLSSSLSHGRYVPTTDEQGCRGFDVALITVPTPLFDGAPDLSHIRQAGHLVARHLRKAACVVLESTTYPGTTEKVLLPILEEGSRLKVGLDFFLGFSPERIDPGNRRWTIANTPKLVSGVTPQCCIAIQDFYADLVDQTVLVSGTGEAELAKLLENTFRHINIALVNEMAVSARELGLDIWQALEAASTKPFGFMRFDPGPGVGGHCLPVDPSYLSWEAKRRSGSPLRFVELANDINNAMPHYVVDRLMLGLNRLKKSVAGSQILLLGLAYKADTSDLRESPALRIADRLLELGATVKAADPHVRPDATRPAIERVALNPESLARADAVLLLTTHSTFDYRMIEARANYVLDTRHKLSGPMVEYL